MGNTKFCPNCGEIFYDTSDQEFCLICGHQLEILFEYPNYLSEEEKEILRLDIQPVCGYNQEAYLKRKRYYLHKPHQKRVRLVYGNIKCPICYSSDVKMSSFDGHMVASCRKCEHWWKFHNVSIV